MSIATRRLQRSAQSVSSIPIVCPTASIAANYKTLVFNDDFVANTVDAVGTASAGQGYNWTVKQPFSNDPPAATVSIANSVLTLSQTAENLNQGIFTSNRGTQSHLVGPFQYGYFEARMKFDASLVTTSSGWPSFWSIGATHLLLQNGTRWPELDFFEFAVDAGKPSGGVYAASIHDHDDTTGTEVDHWNSGYNTVNVNPATWNIWHLYGCLWQPGSIQWYFDDVLISTQTYSATTQNPPASSGNPAGAYSILDDSSAGPATLVLGTGMTCPIQVDWVRVWQ